jgi:metal-sulfur cluster biosynthetic enzyme
VADLATDAGVEAAVMAALDTVMDPELDESLVQLGFVKAEVLDGGRVRIEFRLPTYWCAPNFAYLMAADARDAVGAVDGVREVELHLRDHFAEDEVTTGVQQGQTFDEAFAELADGGGLDQLRRLFWAKSFTMRQERLLRALLALGATEADLAGMTLGQVGDSDEFQLYLERRRRIGLRTDAAAPLAVMPGGRPIGPDELAAYLRRARSTRVGMEFNSSLCRGLLETRYEDASSRPPTQPSPSRGEG